MDHAVISESIEQIKDYAKLAGLTAEEDLKETTKESMAKRLPWLIILLFPGMGMAGKYRLENIILA